MNTQGISFDNTVPAVEGTWYNYTTNDSFTAVDTFFEDSKLMVRTSDGRILDYNQIQNYVKIDKNTDIATLKENNKNNDLNNSLNELIPKEVSSLINDEPITDPHASPLTKQEPLAHLNIYNTHIDENKIIIDKMLSKCTLPVYRPDIAWKDYPQKQINIISEMMDIPIDNIVDWYINKIDMTQVKEDLIKVIKDYINPTEKKIEVIPVPSDIKEQVKKKPYKEVYNQIDKPIKKVQSKTKKK